MLDHHLNVGPHGIRHQVTRSSTALIDRGFDEINERGDVTISLALESRGYRAAAFVAQYDQQRNVQVLGAVFQATDFSVCRDVSSDADHKQVAEALIKNDFRRHPRISTTEQLSMGMLSGN